MKEVYLKMSGVQMEKLNVRVLLYPDDAVLLSIDLDLLQGALNRLSNVTESISLRCDKTKAMVFDREGTNGN